MENISTSDVFKLPISERILLVEEIWDSIASELNSPQITEEEKAIIDDRLKRYKENPSDVIPWNKAYKNLLNKS
ncbi:MAG: hypothetical protein A2068_08200 [Ignavibacteria bacterium GWB2_35_6b]|nr:MAG: hypothetical protein A2068_08200 [Ignavibacteria bacterium GWB2_35_6b]